MRVLFLVSFRFGVQAQAEQSIRSCPCRSVPGLALEELGRNCSWRSAAREVRRHLERVPEDSQPGTAEQREPHKCDSRSPGGESPRRAHIWHECGEASAWATELVQHQSAHDRDKRFACAEYRKAFSQHAASRCTQVSCLPSAPTAAAHPPGQTFQVGSFTKCSSLLGHQQALTGDRPHTCGICEKVFHRKWDLVHHHHHTHPGEQPFGCYRRGKALAQSIMGYGTGRGRGGVHTRGRTQGRGRSCAYSWKALPQVFCLDPAGKDPQGREALPARSLRQGLHAQVHTGPAWPDTHQEKPWEARPSCPWEPHLPLRDPCGPGGAPRPQGRWPRARRKLISKKVLQITAT